MNRFRLWAQGKYPAEKVPARLRWLYQCALICQAFPAYTLEDVRHLPGSQLRDALTALQLLALAKGATTDG